MFSIKKPEYRNAENFVFESYENFEKCSIISPPDLDENSHRFQSYSISRYTQAASKLGINGDLFPSLCVSMQRNVLR